MFKVDEQSEGKKGIMGVGSDVTRKVRQGLRTELMMRMAMTKKKMAKKKVTKKKVAKKKKKK